MTPIAKKAKNGYPEGLFSELFVCSNKELAPFGTVFIFRPENYLQERQGILFGVIKISDSSPDSSYVVNLLTSVIKKEFFAKSERPAEESFEASLRKANLALAELARHGSTNWAGKINFTAGALSKNSLHFSNLGEASIFLIRSGQIAEISRELDEEKEAEPHPLKTFTNISSGKVEKGDKLIFTTNDLLEIFSVEELRQNAAYFSKEEFPGLLEASLQTNAELAGTIVVDLADRAETRAAAQKPRIPLPPEPKDIDFPVPPEKKLRPVISEIKAAHTSPKGRNIYIKEGEDEAIPQKSLGEKLLSATKNSFAASGKFLKACSRNISEIYRRIRIQGKMRDLSMPKAERSGIISKIRGGSKNIVGRISSFDSQKMKNSGIGLVALVILVLLIMGAFKIFRKTPPPAPAENPSAPAENSAASSVGNDINAKSISNIESVVDISKNTGSLALLENSLFVVSENSRSILKINPDSKTTEENSSSLNTGNFSLLAAMPNLNTIFALTQDRKIVTFTPINKNFQENNISLPDNLKAEEIQAFLTYLYVLDPSANQIYRYPRAEGGFGEQQTWLKSGADIRRAKSFSINGDLYIATNDEITAYLQGKKDDSINFENPNVALAIDAIYSAPNLDNIYVLDNKNHRVAVFSKDGKIVAQYWNDTIAGIKNLAVDEKNKTIYLLKETNLSKFAIE